MLLRHHRSGTAMPDSARRGSPDHPLQEDPETVFVSTGTGIFFAVVRCRLIWTQGVWTVNHPRCDPPCSPSVLLPATDFDARKTRPEGLRMCGLWGLGCQWIPKKTGILLTPNCPTSGGISAAWGLRACKFHGRRFSDSPPLRFLDTPRLRTAIRPRGRMPLRPCSSCRSPRHRILPLLRPSPS